MRLDMCSTALRVCDGTDGTHLPGQGVVAAQPGAGVTTTSTAATRAPHVRSCRPMARAVINSRRPGGGQPCSRMAVRTWSVIGFADRAAVEPVGDDGPTVLTVNPPVEEQVGLYHCRQTETEA